MTSFSNQKASRNECDLTTNYLRQKRSKGQMYALLKGMARIKGKMDNSMKGEMAKEEQLF